MARPLRIQFPGALYHVTSRGNGRDAIYLDDDDRSTWLRVFGEVCVRFGWTCHAWCQMTNHYHAVVETAQANLSAGMRHLNGVYTQRFNRRHGRVGHVLQGRYNAILVDRDAYLLAVARYVVLNPVRAGLVDTPSAWRWSSYAAMTGTAPTPAWLTKDAILSGLTPVRSRAVAAYVRFVRSGGDTASIWNDVRGQIYLCGDDQLRSLAQAGHRATSDEIPRSQRHPLRPPLQSFFDMHSDRRQAMAAAFACGDYTMREIAQAFGVHYTTVSRAVSGRSNRRMVRLDGLPESQMRACKT